MPGQGSRRKKISVAEMMKVPPHRPKAAVGCRHIQTLLMTLGFLCCYAIRVAMSIGLVAMTDRMSANPDMEEFAWDNKIKGLILSAFFWGYVVTHIPGGMIAQRWGVHRLYFCAMFICGLSTVLIPFAAHYGGWEIVVVCRVISGACQGIVPPVLHTLLSKWAPTEERGRLGKTTIVFLSLGLSWILCLTLYERLGTFTYTGGWVGNVLALSSCGLIASSPLGWPGCFYIWGGLTVAWSVAWFFLGKESPADHPSIPIDEKEYIEVSLGVTETSETLSTPWIAILTSGPVWGLLVAQCAQAWGFWMLLTQTPTYMSKVMGYDIAENGLLSALPYLTAWILSFPFSYVSDLVIKKNILSVLTSRKVCNTLGEVLPALALVGLGFVRSDQGNLAVGILTVSVSTNVAVFCGHQVNHMDLSPNYSGTLMGITNAAANVCSTLAPIIAGAIATDQTDPTQWRYVFILSAAVYVVGAIVFGIFGSATVQPWNESTIPACPEEPMTIFKIPEGPPTPEVIKEEKEEEKKEPLDIIR